jgi:predicted GNAT family N-acyltransferase
MTVIRTEDLQACHALRRIVFIEEQGVSEAEEVDGLDDQGIHFLAFREETPVGTARVLVKEDTAKIGRVCVVLTDRGTGQGRALMLAAIDWARAEGLARVELGAQVHAVAFYEGLGFGIFGDPYMDAGIEHRHLELHL